MFWVNQQAISPKLEEVNYGRMREQSIIAASGLCVGKTPAGSVLPSLSSISGRFLRNKQPPTTENKTHSPDQREAYVLAPLGAGNMRLSCPPLRKWTRSNDQSGCNSIRPRFEFLEISVGIIQTRKRQSDPCQQVCADFHSCGEHCAKALRSWTHCAAPADMGAAAPRFLPAKTVWFGPQPRSRKANDCRTVQGGQPGAGVPGSFPEIGVHPTAGTPRLSLRGSGNAAPWGAEARNRLASGTHSVRPLLGSCAFSMILGP